ncbi:MAG TPA: hypothetical protein VKA46_35300 [Gemmataceae bacterium]|nr:hypothetical protein [Gemmataceae bacterium]
MDRFPAAAARADAMSGPTLVVLPPAGVVACEPDIQAATSTVFLLRNRRKPGNFIMASVGVQTGNFSYHVQNLPKDGTGCPGRWLVQLAWEHFLRQGCAIAGIRGEWIFGDNLDQVNALTQRGGMSVEDAARQTWSAARAAERGMRTLAVLAADGTPGQYRSIDVLFTP